MITEVFKHITGVKDVVAFTSTFMMSRVGMNDSSVFLMFDEEGHEVSERMYLMNRELYPPNLSFSLNLASCDVTDVFTLGVIHFIS
jgi:hypothetical protein